VLKLSGYQYFLLVVVFLILAPLVSASSPENGDMGPILIGVLANRGDAIAYEEWGPTAEYLQKKLPPLRFEIIPYSFDEIENATKKHDISFVAANPSVYSYLEYYGLAQRIVNLQVPGDPEPQSVFGGVIFTRSDRDDISDIADIRGKRFVAVDQSSLGGWQAAWKEIKEAGIDPLNDFSSLSFLRTHDETVFAVLNNTADVGTIRSSQIERMVKEGKISFDQLKVLNDMHETYPWYPSLLSTSLYPEWPFAAVLDTDSELSKKVAIALLEMDEEDPAAHAIHGAGWTIAQDHTTVHELLRSLNLPPYDQVEKPTIQEIVRHYWQTILGIVITVIVLSFLLVYTWKTKKDLVHALIKVRESEKALLSSKKELEQVNSQLRESKQRIVDSIQYGLLIQQSILPTRNELDTYLSDYLIISKPLDIVGGDFYFFRQEKDCFYIAVIDCTGHGVPGAFMTMMVNALLSRIIETNPEENPGYILERLHLLVQETLKSQSEQDYLQNGLDIALCRVCPSVNQLIFAGAGLPLIISSENGIEEVLGDRMHLGFSSSGKECVITDHEFNLSSGCRYFMVTDGVFDLPGGEKGYGLGRKGFQNLLRVLKLPLADQKEQLYLQLIEYQNTWSQKDDLLIFGFSVRGEGNHA